MSRLFIVLAACLGLTSMCCAGEGVTISVESPRRAFYRGEDVPLLIKCTNGTDDAIRDGTVTIGFDGHVAGSVAMDEIRAGHHVQKLVRFSSSPLRSGEYGLKVKLEHQQRVLAEATDTLWIGRKLNPDRMMVWLWPDRLFGPFTSKGIERLEWWMDKGFNNVGVFGKVPDEQAEREQAGELLDYALYRGVTVCCFPNGGLKDFFTGLNAANAVDPDPELKFQIGKNQFIRTEEEVRSTGVQIANPFHPQVTKFQDESNRKLMGFIADYPQVKTAYFNTEIVGELRNNKNQAGIQLMRDVLGFTEEDFGSPNLVAPGVIADDDKRLLYQKYLYRHGNGLALANQRAADMVHRFRPDILTISDPYRDHAFLDGEFDGIDVIETWTYTQPDPKLMLYVETLRAVCKPQNKIPINTVTLLNYGGWLTPGVTLDVPTAEWLMMGPDTLKVTTWINLSRAPKILGYYFSSEFDPFRDNRKSEFTEPSATYEALKELSNRVIKPYGPMIKNLDFEARRIAVLSSHAARTYGDSPSLAGYYANMQIYHFYSVMAMAHLQADVVFDETIERFGLDDYDVLVLPKCDVLSKSVYDQILSFQKRGGLVIADQYLKAEIPGVVKFDFDFTYRNRVNANAIAENKAYDRWDDQLDPDSAALVAAEGVTALDDQRIMESYAALLRERLGGKVVPGVDCDQPTVLFNMLEKGAAKYLVVVNDKRTYGERGGKYKAILDKLLPQTATITLNEWEYHNLYAYDMLERKRLDVKKNGSVCQFTVGLTEFGGKIVALYPREFSQLSVRVPNKMQAGTPCSIAVTLADQDGSSLPGLQPVELTITDPKGNRNEYSDYYCTREGTLHISFIPAVNDEKGMWKVTATDLTAGLVAEQSFEVQ